MYPLNQWNSQKNHWDRNYDMIIISTSIIGISILILSYFFPFQFGKWSRHIFHLLLVLECTYILSFWNEIQIKLNALNLFFIRIDFRIVSYYMISYLVIPDLRRSVGFDLVLFVVEYICLEVVGFGVVFALLELLEACMEHFQVAEVDADTLELDGLLKQ